MAEFAELSTEISCPNCQQIITSFVCFQWGKVPNKYKIGDKIEWIKNKKGQIFPPFTILKGRDQWNAGLSDLTNIIILDSNYFAPELKPKCSNCNTSFDGIAIYIIGEFIVSAKALTHGELYNKYGVESMFIDTIVVNNEKFYPRYDLYDCPLTYIQE